MRLLQKVSIIIISLSLFMGCNKDPSDLYEILDTDNTNKFYRDFDYDQNIILANKLDLTDFKNIYTEAEILKILGDSLNIENHPSILIDDEFSYLNIFTLVHRSYDIIEGNVATTEPIWDSDHKFIYTEKYITIEKSLKNKIESRELIICDMGGELDGYATFIPYNPLPIYNAGEYILCFVQRSISTQGDITYFTYGRRQGKFVLMD